MGGPVWLRWRRLLSGDARAGLEAAGRGEAVGDGEGRRSASTRWRTAGWRRRSGSLGRRGRGEGAALLPVRVASDTPSRDGARREGGKRNEGTERPWRPRGPRRRRGGRPSDGGCHGEARRRGWRGRGRASLGGGGSAAIGREGGGVSHHRGRRRLEAWRGRHLRRGGGVVKAGWPGADGTLVGARGDGGAGEDTPGGH